MTPPDYIYCYHDDTKHRWNEDLLVKHATACAHVVTLKTDAGVKQGSLDPERAPANVFSFFMQQKKGLSSGRLTAFFCLQLFQASS